jgi:hypothetical protein
MNSDGLLTSQGRHLLTRSFFAELRRVLKHPAGRVTIVSDSQQYILLLAQTLSGSSGGGEVEHGEEMSRRASFTSAPLEPSPGRQVEKTIAIEALLNEPEGRRIEIWRGEPGREAGHVDEEASSYFDRMWEKGKKRRRWFLFLMPC